MDNNVQILKDNIGKTKIIIDNMKDIDGIDKMLKNKVVNLEDYTTFIAKLNNNSMTHLNDIINKLYNSA